MPSKLEQLQLQFRQRLMQEKEERMIKIHTDNQQKALNRVMKYEPPPIPVASRKSPHNTQNHQSPVKKSSPGVDRSRPLPPISKEQKSHTAAGRSNGFSSDVVYKVPFQNGVRSKSMDVDAGDNFKFNSRTKPRTDVNHVVDTSTISKSSVVNHVGRRSPSESDTQRKTQTELIRAKALAKAQANQHHDSSKSNGYHHQTASYKSSMNETKTNTVNVKPQVSNNFSVKGKFKTTTSTTTVTRKPTTVLSKTKKGENVKPMHKPPNPNQEQCRICGRNFNKDRIEKHQSICIKASKKKTKVFDATKMRVQGTEAENFVKKGVTIEPATKNKKANWKKQHEEFINTIRQAKMAQRHLAAGGKLSDLPPPPPSDTSDYVPCPYCGRKFSEQVADRHIPKCKNILSNKKNPPKKK